MNKKEAIQAMLDGKKVRSSNWTNEKEYIFYDEKSSSFKGYNSGRVEINDQYSIGWEIYKETKKMKFWQFIKDSGKASSALYSEDFKHRWDGKRVVAPASLNVAGWIRTNCFIEVDVDL